MKKWLYFKSDGFAGRQGVDLKPFRSSGGETDWEQRYRAKVGSMDDAAWEKQKQAKADVIDAVVPWLGERFPEPGRTRILELACGFAGVGQELLARGYDVHLSDYSPSLVRGLLVPRLEALGHDPSRAFVADVTDLSAFAPATGGGEAYDVVLCSGLYGFCDMGRMQAAYREIRTLVRPGGLFIHWADSYCNGYVDMVTAPVIRQAVNLERAVAGLLQVGLLLLKANALLRKLTRRSPVPPIHVEPIFYGWLLTEEQMAAMLQKAGFAILEAAHLCADEGQSFQDQELSWLGGVWSRLKDCDPRRMWGRRLLMVAEAGN